MGTRASQITSLMIVYSTVYSDANQRKHQSSASLAFVRGIHRGPVKSPHKWPVTRKMFPFDDVIMASDRNNTRAPILNPFHNMDNKLMKKITRYVWIMAEILHINLTPIPYFALPAAIFCVNSDVTTPVNSTSQMNVTNEYHSNTKNLLASAHEWVWIRFEFYGSALEYIIISSSTRLYHGYFTMLTLWITG